MPESKPDSAFDSQELDFLVRFLDSGFGRISAAVVPGPAVGSVLLEVLQARLPDQVFRIADTEPPAELNPIALGERAEEASCSGEIFVLPLDGRHRPVGSDAEADFWRRMNYQRERLAADQGRTLFLLDEQAEARLTSSADDLHDWVRTFRFPNPVPLASPPDRDSRFFTHVGVIEEEDPFYDPRFLGPLRRQLQAAREQGLPERQVARFYAFPLWIALVSQHRPTDAAKVWNQDLLQGEALEPLELPVDQFVYTTRIDLARLEGDDTTRVLWTTKYLQAAEKADNQDGSAHSAEALLDAIYRHGQALVERERLLEAIRLFERGLDLVEARQQQLPKERAAFGRALFLGRLGYLYGLLESPKIAETYLRGTVEILRDLVKLPSHQYLEELSIALNALGQYLWLSKRSLSEALTCHEESLELARTLLTASPNDPAILRDVAISLERRGDVLLSLGRLREAESDYRQRLKIARDLAERDPGNKIWQEDLSIARERLESVTH